MHALLDAFGGFHRNTQKFDAVAKLSRGVEVGRRDRGDAFAIDRARIYLGAEGQARENGEFLRGVMALNVKAGIGFGVTEPLRFFEAIGKAQPLLLHAGENVIAGAV